MRTLLFTLLVFLWACTAEQRCEKLNKAPDCAEAALRADVGVDGKAKDPARATVLFTRACDLGDGQSCIHLGVQEESAGNVSAAAPWYQRACGLGAGQGCGQLALLYQDGALDKLKDFETARIHHENACRLGWGKSCTALGRMLAEGRGLARDLEAGKALFDKGCTAIAKDEESCEAKERMACSATQVAEWSEICPAAATPAIVAPPPPKPVSSKRKRTPAPVVEKVAPVTVDAKNVSVCEALADCRLMGWGEVEKSVEGARDVYRTGCESGSRISCNALGILHEEGTLKGYPDYFEASKYYQAACFKRHWPGSCTAVGRIAEEQLKDIERARRYYTVGCNAKLKADCEALAKLPPAPAGTETKTGEEAEE